MMLDRRACREAVSRLQPEHFYHPGNGHIFAAIESLFIEGDPVDPVTVASELSRMQVLDQAGGPARLLELMSQAPTPSHVPKYAETIAEKATIRAQIQLASTLIEDAYNGAIPAKDLNNRAVSDLLALQQGAFRGNLQLAGDVADLAVAEVEGLAAGTIPPGMATGFVDLDDLTGGMTPGQLWIPAAITSAGKTSLMLAIVAHVAVKLGRPVLFHTLEMSAVEIMKRLLAGVGSVSAKGLRTGRLDDDNWVRLYDAQRDVSASPLWVDDNSNAKVEDLRTNVIDIAGQVGEPPALIVVDYAQIMDGGQSDPNRQQQVADISRALKALAMRPIPNDDRRAVVMAASQLRRTVEERKDKRPMLSDLRESGSLAQDADVVLGLYRDELHNRESETPGIAEVQVLKSRASGTGTVMLRYVARYTTFTSLDLGRML